MPDVIRSEPAAAAASLPPASLFRRLAAMCYDTLVVAALFMLSGYLALIVTGGTAVQAGNPWFRLLLLLLAGGYFCASWVRGGQTLGMRAWRLCLVDEHDQSVGIRTAVLRLGAATIAALPAGLGYLWSLFGRRRQTWHDRWTATRVIVLPKRSR